jgi:hypothetical protein
MAAVFPDDADPPVWIQHMIMGDQRRLTMVTFTLAEAEHTRAILTGRP